MELLEARLKRCETCKRLSGHVEERYNGAVPVYCRCEIKKRFGGRWESPSLISLADDKVMWTPISDHREADGKRWHTPWFAGMTTNQKQLGKEIPKELLNREEDGARS